MLCSFQAYSKVKKLYINIYLLLFILLFHIGHIHTTTYKIDN